MTTPPLPDRPTRGRTAPGRLRALDAWVCRAEAPLLARADGPWATAAFVDLGLGEDPATTVEAAAAFRALRPDLPVIGVDREATRVEAARAVAPGDYRLGTFDLPLEPGESVRLLRVMNLLRAHRPADVHAIHAHLGSQLLDGALLLEGTSDPEGGVLVTHLLRRRGADLVREGLLFHTDFRQGFAPILFRDRLPRDLRHVPPGHPLRAFFANWTAAWHAVRGPDAVASFVVTVPALATRLDGIDLDPWLADHGTLVWRPPGGVPAGGP